MLPRFVYSIKALDASLGSIQALLSFAYMGNAKPLCLRFDMHMMPCADLRVVVSAANSELTRIAMKATVARSFIKVNFSMGRIVSTK